MICRTVQLCQVAQVGALASAWQPCCVAWAVGRRVPGDPCPGLLPTAVLLPCSWGGPGSPAGTWLLHGGGSCSVTLSSCSPQTFDEEQRMREGTRQAFGQGTASVPSSVPLSRHLGSWAHLPQDTAAADGRGHVPVKPCFRLDRPLLTHTFTTVHGLAPN